ncbi:ion transporter [Antribacter gilvus]|uniref:ion transporter n=1 Tax=Antribacter gilvus TaxID=2304675 RepID=UPI000F791C92|nr:ion transporter [Antribacter gilvus]
MDSRSSVRPGARTRVRAFVEDARFQRVVIWVITANAVLLGLETSEPLMDAIGPELHALDRAMLAFFVVELTLRLYAHGWRFFTNAWNVFDLLVVGISLVPTGGPLGVLRALRILRVLRLVSTVPSMRRVVDGLLAAVPGMASVGALLALVIYVSAVIGTNLFGATSPGHFGNLGVTLFTLFQTMTGEAWPDVAREVMAAQPMAWIFFVVYILVVGFAVLNLFIAVIVSGMEGVGELAEHEASTDAIMIDELRALRAEIAALRAEMPSPAPR